MYEQIAANKRRTVVLVAGFVLVLAAAGAAVGLIIGYGWWGAGIAFVISGILAFASYWKSDAVALAVSRAEPADPNTYKRLYNLVEGLTIASGLPMPRIYIVHDAAPNAFATGRNPRHAAIAVTTGLIAVTLVGAVVLLSDVVIRMMWWNGGRVPRQGDRQDQNNPLALVGFVFIILAPILAKVMQAAVSRNRETLADVSAVQMTRYPPGLISALEKLRDDTTVTHSASKATAHLWIEQPMSGVGDKGRQGWLNKLFDTHPPLEERIALLREL
jgi:heat shock protein HtpX